MSRLNKGMFSSDVAEWGTPQWLFDELHAVFQFDLDVAASHENHKCSRYWTQEIDCLTQNWSTVQPSRGRDYPMLWLNPPYGEPEQPCKPNCQKIKCGKRGHHVNTYQPGIIDFIGKAYEESLHGASVVVLAPARTDTVWAHEYLWKADELLFIKGRLKFELVGNPQETTTAPFPSVLALFGYEGVSLASVGHLGKLVDLRQQRAA